MVRYSNWVSLRTLATVCVSMSQITHRFFASIEANFRILQIIVNGVVYPPTYPKYQNIPPKKKIKRVLDKAQLIVNSPKCIRTLMTLSISLYVCINTNLYYRLVVPKNRSRLNFFSIAQHTFLYMVKEIFSTEIGRTFDIKKKDLHLIS